MLKNGSKLTLLTMTSRILGLVREITRAALLGTSVLSDAYSVAFLIPNLFRRLFAENSMTVAFIPTFKRYLEEKNKDEIKKFLSATFTFLSFIISVTVVIGILITPLIIPLFGLSTPETVLLTRIMFPYLAVISIAAFFQGILNGIKIFSPSGFTPILFNLCIIGCAWLLSPVMQNPARAMAVGVLLGGVIQAGFQLPFILKNGFRFHFVSIRNAFTDPGTKTIVKLIAPTIVGMAAYQLNELVSTILAGHAGPGIVSSLQFSLRLQELILGVFAVSIGTVILPDLTDHVVQKDWKQFNTLLSQAIETIALITIPVTFYSLVSGKGIITLLFRGMNFSEESVNLTLAAFTWHIAGLYFIALNRIIAPAFYAQGDTRSPTIAGITGVIFNIILATILVFPMKGGGIALALSIASAVNTILLLFFLKRMQVIDIGKILRAIILYALKITAFSLVAALPIWLFRTPIYARFAGHNRLISQGIPLIISLVIFAGIGIGLLFLTRDKIAVLVISGIRKKQKRHIRRTKEN